MHVRRSVPDPRLIVVTGGPGAGKTALLEVVRRQTCRHVVVLPEAASILYGGGFPRRSELPARRAAQRAIFRVERELERMAVELGGATAVICDRGTIDGQAYWPGDRSAMWTDLGTDPDTEMARYHAVIHLRTPPAHLGYNHANPLRIETAEQALEIDATIAELWRSHPRRFEIPSDADFVVKLTRALDILRDLVPECEHARVAAPAEAPRSGGTK
jgi:predicted ATPase